MSRLWQTFKTLSPVAQFGLVAIIPLVLALVISSTIGIVSGIKDKRFDKVQAEREAQIQAITTERNEAIGRAQAWEQRAKDAEAKIAISEAALEVASTKVESAKAELEKEDERYKKEVEAVGDDIDNCTRIIRICERAKQLGLYPKNKACECE